MQTVDTFCRIEWRVHFTLLLSIDSRIVSATRNYSDYCLIIVIAATPCATHCKNGKLVIPASIKPNIQSGVKRAADFLMLYAEPQTKTIQKTMKSGEKAGGDPSLVPRR